MKSEWPTKNFGDLVDFVTEKSNANFAKINSYISTENMEPNFGGVKNAKTLPLSGSVGKFKFSDTLFSNIRTYFKKVWLAEFDGHCSNDVLIFRSKNNSTLNPNFLFNLCRWEKFTELSVRTSKGSKMPRGDSHALKKFEFKLPPIDYQIETTEILTYLDDRITLLRETNTTLEAIAQALFKSWFIDFDPVHAKMQGQAPQGMDEATAALFPDSFEESELGPIPKGWEWKSLKEAYQINPNRQLKKGQISFYLDMANVNITGHGVRSIVQREMGSGTKFINGDTLLARITPCLENGKTAFVDFLPDATTGWGSTEFVVLRPKSPLPTYHAYLLARHPSFREHAIRSMSGTSGRQRIQNDVLSQFLIAMPSENVAVAFNEIITTLQERIQKSNTQANQLTEIRNLLLPHLISGKLLTSKNLEISNT